MAGSKGVLSVLRDVSLRQAPDGQLVVVDREARLAGDIVTVELLIDSVPTLRQMRVEASVPVVRQGKVMHQMKLVSINTEGGDTETR